MEGDGEGEKSMLVKSKLLVKLTAPEFYKCNEVFKRYCGTQRRLKFSLRTF